MRGKGTVIVIGGGVIGVCCAYYLAEQDVPVTLLERDEVCSGCSYGNAGLIVPSHCVPLANPASLRKGLKWFWNPESPFFVRPHLDFGLLKWLWWFQRVSRDRRLPERTFILCTLLRLSRALYDELAHKGFPFPFKALGRLTVFRTSKAFGEGIEEAESLRKGFGIPYHVLEADEALQREPTLRPEIVGAIFHPTDGHLDPAAFVLHLAEFVKGKGVRILTGTNVRGLEVMGQRVIRVMTNRGDFIPDQVVLAAGAWSALLARGAGVKLALQPAKGYSMDIVTERIRPTIPLILDEARVAITPLNGRVRVGGTLELTGLDLSLNKRRLRAIRRAICNYLRLRGQEVSVWCGLRPCTPDGLPLLGRPSSLSNLIVATGHGMLGVSLAPVTGKLVAQIILGEAPDMDLRLLGPDRFRS